MAAALVPTSPYVYFWENIYQSGLIEDHSLETTNCAKEFLLKTTPPQREKSDTLLKTMTRRS